MRLVILRHGTCEGICEKIINGWNDVKLTEDGEQEVRDVAEKLYSLLNGKVNQIYTSYLDRAYSSAKIVADKFNIKQVIQDIRLNERHFGFFQGMNRFQARDYDTYSTIADKNYDIYLRPRGLEDSKREKEVENFANKLHINKAEAENIVPNGETIGEVESRIIAFLNDVIKEENNDKTVIVVTHSNIIKLMKKQLEKLSYEDLTNLQIDTCAIKVYNLNVYGNSVFNVSVSKKD